MRGIAALRGLACIVSAAIAPFAPVTAQESAATDGGALVIAGGGRLPDSVYERFGELGAAGRGGVLVVIPTASARADDPEQRDALLDPWRDSGFAELSLLHTRDRREADGETFVAPLRRATAVWIGGGDQSRLVAAYGGTRTLEEIRGVVARGGVVGGSSAGAACQSDPMIAGGRGETVDTTRGLGLLRGAIVDQHFLARGRFPRLVAAVRRLRDRVGIGIDEGTALVVRGSTAEILGDSRVVVVLAEGAGRRLAVTTHRAGTSLDLVALARSARRRASGLVWPPRLGAGGAPLAGGRVVVAARVADTDRALEEFLIASRLAVPDLEARDGAVLILGFSHDAELIERVAAKMAESGVRAVVASAPPRVDAWIEPERLAALARAAAVWIVDGSHAGWHDVVAETPLRALLAALVSRGGVVGGAGAEGLGDARLVDADLEREADAGPFAEGKDVGLGLLPGAVFAHGRDAELRSAIGQHPGLLGVSLTEDAVLVLDGRTGTLSCRAGRVELLQVLDPGETPSEASTRPKSRIVETNGKAELPLAGSS
jgi:cyanophycinase